MKAGDPQLKSKLLTMGMTLWIDTTGKGKQILGIEYPVKQDFSALRQKRNTTDRMPGNRLAQLKENLNEIHFMGFNGESSSNWDFVDNHFMGCNIQIDFDEYNLYYKASIPLKSLNITKLNPNKVLGFGFVSGYVDASSMQGNMQGGGMKSGGRSGGGGRGGGGGRQGASQRPEPSQMQGMTSPTKLWIKKVNLSVNK